MSTIELTGLESQIDYLFNTIEQLKLDNQSLRQKLVVNTQEKTKLKQQNQQAIEKVKRILRQLKEETA